MDATELSALISRLLKTADSGEFSQTDRYAIKKWLSRGGFYLEQL